MKDITLEVGMYVRTKYKGIKKIIESSEWGIILDCKDTFNNDYFISSLSLENNILKARFNKIDLIEVGDYVNGMKVTGLDYKGTKDVHELICNGDYGYKSYLIKPKYIKSIVTKEQFSSMEYKFEE